MESQLGSSLIPVLIGLSIGVVGSIIDRKWGRLVINLIIALVLGSINWIVYSKVHPHFFVFPFDDWGMIISTNLGIFVVINLLLSLLESGTNNYYDDSPKWGAATTLLYSISGLVWLFILIGATIINPQPPLDRSLLCSPEWDSRNSQLAKLFQVKSDNNFNPGISYKLLPQRSYRAAYKEAVNTLPADLASWLSVSKKTGYLAEINGRQTWLFELVPSFLGGEQSGGVNTYNAFMQKGGKIPGYILVDAINPSSRGVYVPMPGANFAFDIDEYTGKNVTSHLYYNFETPYHRYVDDPGIEVLDSGQVVYTAAVLKPDDNMTALNKFESAIFMDPVTGNIVTQTVEQMDASVDRIFGQPYVENSVDYWGKFHETKWCPQSNLDKQVKRDHTAYVFTEKGMMYQITLTPIGKTTQIKYVWYQSPRTGEVHLVDPGTTLFSVESIKETIETTLRQSQQRISPDVELENCVLLPELLKEPVTFCIAVDPIDSDPSKGDDKGYVFVRNRFSTGQAGSWVIGPTVGEAYNQLTRIVSENPEPTQMSQTTTEQLFEGQIVRKQVVGNEIVLFLNTSDLTFVIPVSQSGGYDAALAEVGEEVQLKGDKSVNDKRVFVREFKNKNQPNWIKTPVGTPN